VELPEEVDLEKEKAEKQRLLAALEQNVPFPKKAAAPSRESEDTNALAGLYRQSVGLPGQSETDNGGESTPKPPQNITRITHYEIRAMKVKSATQDQKAAQTKKSFADFFIRAWFGITEVFAPRLDKRSRCQMHGHECLHCGAKFLKIPSEKE
jgi:hypothetical protein